MSFSSFFLHSFIRSCGRPSVLQFRAMHVSLLSLSVREDAFLPEVLFPSLLSSFTFVPLLSPSSHFKPFLSISSIFHLFPAIFLLSFVRFLSIRPRFSHLIFHLSFLLFASQNFSHLCLVFHLLQAYFRIFSRPLFKSNFFNSFLVIYMKPILSFALHSLVLSFYEPR